MTILLFEDERVTQLYPVTVGRPAAAVSCGSYDLLSIARMLDADVRMHVRPHLREISTADYLTPSKEQAGAPLLLLNARLVPSVGSLKAVRDVLSNGRPGIVRRADGVSLALLPSEAARPPADASVEQFAAYLNSLQLSPLDLEVGLPLLNYPHEVIRYHQQTLAGNLEHRLSSGGYQEIAEGVFAAPGASLGPHVVTDASRGPILLEEGARIGPYCYLSGPAHLARRARVIEHAAIKDGVALGHTTKVGGEVEASIIESYTNKQHHGFLGHSYLGSWVNLGAGTCNSDLKNTYGQINMEYAGQKVPTGMQFFGCVVGDYAKTAINTGIFTGKSIGACSMVYGFVTTNVPSFTNYARSFGQVTEAPVEVMVSAQARMFARRNVQQRPCDIRLLYDMYELTRHERQIAGEPLSL